MSGHPSDELLASYALDPMLVENVEELERHLDDCGPCRERLEKLQSIETLLAEAESWTYPIDVLAPQPPPQRLIDVAARNRREDAEADAMLAPLVEKFLGQSSKAFLWVDIAARREFHTAGVVRKLADAADRAQYSVPRRALALAETASEIVGFLSTKKYTAAEIAALRGVSWKQQANAHRQLGQFREALDALDRAERAFRELPRPELDLASITFIRGTVNMERGEHDLAQQLAEMSTAAFARLGQTEFYFRSRYLEGRIAFELGDIGRAQTIFDAIYAYGDGNSDASWTARASFELGNCYLERRELANASHMFQQSMLAFRELAMATEELRCRWGLALVVQREGRHDLAVSRLRDVRDKFGDQGMVLDAALVTLDLMETFLLLGKPREVRKTAGKIVQLFKAVGVVSGALTAADYLKQAAAMRNVTPTLIDHIRRYLRRVDRQPDLAFIPPL